MSAPRSFTSLALERALPKVFRVRVLGRTTESTPNFPPQGCIPAVWQTLDYFEVAAPGFAHRNAGILAPAAFTERSCGNVLGVLPLRGGPMLFNRRQQFFLFGFVQAMRAMGACRQGHLSGDHPSAVALVACPILLHRPLALILKPGAGFDLPRGSAAASLIINNASVGTLTQRVRAAFVGCDTSRKAVIGRSWKGFVLMVAHAARVHQSGHVKQSGIPLMEVSA